MIDVDRIVTAEDLIQAMYAEAREERARRRQRGQCCRCGEPFDDGLAAYAPRVVAPVVSTRRTEP